MKNGPGSPQNQGSENESESVSFSNNVHHSPAHQEENDNDNGGENPANQNNQGSNFVLMKKSKKFIKFKDFIIKLPNSLGLIQHKQLLNNDSMPFVES
jgi:hypothetical protein